MYGAAEDMVAVFKKLIDFDTGDREFGPNFGDLVQAMSRASTLGADFLLDETKHAEGVHPDTREMVIDSLANQLVKVFVYLIRQQERHENIFGDSRKDYEAEPDFPGFNVPELPTLGDGVKGYNLISDEAMGLFHRLLAERNGEASE